MTSSADPPRKKRPPDPVVKKQQSYYEPNERFEIIGGVRYDFLASPKFVHQKILTNFYLAFHKPCSREGEILLAPLDVHLDEDNILQPDVIFIRNDRLHLIRDGYIYGAPDLVVEILSESTGKRDKTIKKAAYEQFGVKEYWLADPIYRTVEQFVLSDGKYALLSTLTEEDVLYSATVDCLEIDLGTIFPSADQTKA